MTRSNTAPPVLYKVLLDGRSWHGGSMKWSLPTQGDDGSWTPGEWHGVEGEVVLCQNGLHLTDRPLRWHGDGARIYEAEAEGVVGLDELENSTGRKVAARRVRLLREVDRAGFEDADHARQAIEEGNAEARRIVERARQEARQIVYDAHRADDRDARRAKRERADRLRAASLTPAKRRAERREGKVSASTAYLLAATAANGRGSRSCLSLDHAVHGALRLAIDLRADFDVSDVADVERDFGVHWGANVVVLEGLYEAAVEANHAAACASIERALGRKPWIVGGRRLARGSHFRWEGEWVSVTSFDDAAGTLTACFYQHDDEPKQKPCGCPNYGSRRVKVERRFRVRREAFDAAYPAKKPAKKAGAR